MTTNSSAGKARRHLLWVGLLLFAAVTALPIFENPYDEVIDELATEHDWDKDGIQMITGENSELLFLRWTRVDLVIRNASIPTPIYVTGRKRPFSGAYIACYSVGEAERCAG